MTAHRYVGIALAALRTARAIAVSLPARLSWASAGVLHRVGWAGMAGAALMALGTAALLLSSLHLEPLVERDREQLARARAEARSRPQPMAEARQTPTARLEQFYGDFPAVAGIPRTLGTLVTLAAANGLALDQGQYRLGAEPAGSLLRYEMKLPVRGTYRQIRAFVEAVLAQEASFALDGIEFKREAVRDATLEAVLDFSLYVRAR